MLTRLSLPSLAHVRESSRSLQPVGGLDVAPRRLAPSQAVFLPPSSRAQRSFAISASTSAFSIEQGMERLRLHNLSPQPGSRRPRKRKGRGHSAGQGGSCGYGMRGQKSRAGSGIRPGFEGGQTPLYRRLPKLRGVAGGMPSGQPKHVTFNLAPVPFPLDIEVNLDSLREARVLNPTGKKKKLPLKILAGKGWAEPRAYRAAAFSESAIAAIERVGGQVILEPTKPKWTRQLAEKKKAEELENAKRAES